LTPSPIGKVLSTFRKHRVRALLMGGQACILYGAAEFSRDVDVAVDADDRNLNRLRRALAELQADPIFVPPLGSDVLLRGHACHFRVQIPQARGIRIDVMSVMNGCDAFLDLWKRRRRLRIPKVGLVNLLGLSDLVRAKKTQRDKDWPMVRRLVEADFDKNSKNPTEEQILFWLQEARNPHLLVELCRRFSRRARQVAKERPAVRYALLEDMARAEKALRQEEEAFRSADRLYWQPLRAQLFQWRRAAKPSR
jgi:hypothetical protein